MDARLILLLGLVPSVAAAQNHRVIGDTPELGTWVEAAALNLADDGTGGDAVAGDGVYTAVVSFAAGALPGPRTLRWLILPDGASLAAGAVGQADGSAMRIDLPDELSRSIEFRFTPTAPAGFGPEPGLADSWTTGLATDPTLRRVVSFLAQGGFQSHFGGLGWNVSDPSTLLRDDGVLPDQSAGDGLSSVSIVVPVPLEPTTELDWSVGASGATAVDQSLELGSNGWGFAADGVMPTPFTLTLSPWQPGRFEFDRLRGMARQVSDDAAFETPLLSEIADSARLLSWVEIANPGSAALSLDGLFLSDDPAFPLLPAALPPVATGNDATAAFPAGASLPPGGHAVITWPGATGFFAAHGRFPDFELLAEVPAVPEMVATHAGAIDLAPELDGGGEFLVLARFSIGDTLVEDVDLVSWGSPPATELFPDRVDTMPTGGTPAYGPEAGTFRSESAPGVGLHARKALDEGAELRVACTPPCPVNGSAQALPSGLVDHAAGSGARHDETSEALATTWALSHQPTPGAPNAVDRFVTGRVEDGAGNTVELADVQAARGPARIGAVSDASGAFRIGPLEQGVWTFQASKATAGLSQLASLEVEGDAALPAPLTLDGSPGTFSVSGVILDASNGAGLTGATLTATPGAAVAVAGTGGTYLLDLPPGATTLVASFPGFAAEGLSLILGSDQVRNFSLGPGNASVAVSGTVTESGGPPLAAARLSLESGSGLTFVVQTAADGSFLFPAVASDSTYQLEASHPTHLGVGIGVPVNTTDVSGLSLELEPRPSTFSISGTVLDARDDNPLIGATVLIESGGSTLTDTAGAFQVAGLADGAQVVHASGPGFATTRQDVTLAGADLADLTLRLATDQRFVLQGQVLDANDDRPLPAATVSLTAEATGTTTSVETDDRGAFSWVEVREGSYSLVVDATDYLSGQRTLTLGPDTTMDFHLSPDPNSRLSLSGTIALEGLEAGSWEGSEVSLEGQSSAQVTTAANGAYRFDDLLSGSYVLVATHAGFLEGSLPVELQRSGQQDLLLGTETPAVSPPPGCDCDSGGPRPESTFVALLIIMLGLVARRR